MPTLIRGQGRALFLCSPAKWPGCHFLLSLDQIPSFPRERDDADNRLGCCSGLWLTHKQVGERAYFLPILPAIGQLGARKPSPLLQHTAPQARRSSTAQDLGAGSCSTGSICWGRNSTNLLEGLCLFLCPLILFKHCPHISWLWSLYRKRPWSFWWVISHCCFPHLFASDKEWWGGGSTLCFKLSLCRLVGWV